MKEPYEKGIANHSAPSFALDAVKHPAKRKQGKRRAGYRASKSFNRDADAVIWCGRQHDQERYASFWLVLRSLRPQARLETPYTRTGRPRRCLK
jgi:hypothetical protein